MKASAHASIMFTIVNALAGPCLAQSPEYKALNLFSSGHTKFLAIIKLPGHVYYKDLPGFICTIYYDTQPNSPMKIKCAVIGANTSSDKLIEIASNENSKSHYIIECPSKMIKTIKNLSVPHSLAPSTGWGSAAVDVNQIFVLYKTDETESFTNHWTSNSAHPISQLAESIQSVLAARLTQRSTRTLPLRSDHLQ